MKPGLSKIYRKSLKITSGKFRRNLEKQKN